MFVEIRYGVACVQFKVTTHTMHASLSRQFQSMVAVMKQHQDLPAFPALESAHGFTSAQDTSLEASVESITQTQDQYGTLAPRNSWLVMERTMLCQALLYAVYLSPEVLQAETVRELVVLVEYTSLRHKVPAGMLGEGGRGLWWGSGYVLESRGGWWARHRIYWLWLKVTAE